MILMNAHSLFLGSRQITTYHEAISPCDKAHAKLAASDKKIRLTLRSATEEIKKSTQRLVAMSVNRYWKNHKELTFDVRFLWQGSKVYKTDIDPAHKPPQQVDLDDGIYLRTSFLENSNPAVASDRFFRFVENALEPLCEQKGWNLIYDKNTCVRIEIDGEKHIDLPLYAIPDEEFSTLEKAAMRTFGKDISMRQQNVHMMFDQERSLRIPRDRVMLAHREHGWIHSDPRALHDWFLERVEEFGPQLRRMCRYLKGWRDFEFSSGGGPESITLMVCVVQAYREINKETDESRDDIMLLEISKRLEVYFRSDIANPVMPDNKTLLNNWKDIERQQFINAAGRLLERLQCALEGTFDTGITVDKLVEIFGHRLPSRPDLVKQELEQKSVATISATAKPLALSKPTISG